MFLLIKKPFIPKIQKKKRNPNSGSIWFWTFKSQECSFCIFFSFLCLYTEKDGYDLKRISLLIWLEKDIVLPNKKHTPKYVCFVCFSW